MMQIAGKPGRTRTRSIADWPLRQRWLFVLLSFLLMGAGIYWCLRHDTIWVWLGLAALIVSTPMVGYGCRSISFTDDGPLLPAERRFMREFSIAMPVYFVLVIVLWGNARGMQHGWLRALVAVSPALPVAWLVMASTRLIMNSDELMQRIHLQALAVASGAVSVLSMALGFLAASRVVKLDGGVLLWVFPVLAWIYGLMRWWLTRRLRKE